MFGSENFGAQFWLLTRPTRPVSRVYVGGRLFFLHLIYLFSPFKRSEFRHFWIDKKILIICSCLWSTPFDAAFTLRTIRLCLRFVVVSVVVNIELSLGQFPGHTNGLDCMFGHVVRGGLPDAFQRRMSIAPGSISNNSVPFVPWNDYPQLSRRPIRCYSVEFRAVSNFYDFRLCVYFVAVSSFEK